MSNQNTATNTVAEQSKEQRDLEIAQLKAQIAALKAVGTKPKKATTALIDGLSCAVSEKGAISIYGLGRFPVTLYRHQLQRLITVIPMLQAFVTANADKLSVKPEVVK